ncbi:MAG: GNAT family N-acetyltransferase [Lachnospiraceae bacterium]
MAEIKELSVKNVEEIKRFFRDVFTKEPWNDDWSDEDQLHNYILDLIGNPNSLTFGLFEEGEMIGLSMGNVRHWYEGTEYHVDELCIKTEKQGQGLGSCFLKKIEEQLNKRDIRFVFLLTERNVPAFSFYLKNGFSELKENVALVKGGLSCERK